MKQLTNRTAVVTGAASDIGLAVTEAFLGAGMSVVMTDVSEDALREQASRLSGDGARVLALVTDVSDPEAVERLAQAAVQTFGQLHVAVNNAGIVNQGNSWEISLEEWHLVINANLWGVVHGIRSFVPRILASGEEGHVVNTGSLTSVMTMNKIGPYTVTEAGVLGLSDVLRAELEAIGAPVGVSVVMPGGIKTGLNPAGTVTTQQVAANVVAAVRRGRPYVFTDDDRFTERHGMTDVQTRLTAILRARDDVLS